jgi:hypothetical protein
MTRFGFDLAAWFTDNAHQIRRDLQSYFEGGKEPFTGRWFDEFAAIGDPNRFEASDVLAVEALKVEVPSDAAAALLITDANGSTPCYDRFRANRTSGRCDASTSMSAAPPTTSTERWWASVTSAGWSLASCWLPRDPSSCPFWTTRSITT